MRLERAFMPRMWQPVFCRQRAIEWLHAGWVRIDQLWTAGDDVSAIRSMIAKLIAHG